AWAPAREVERQGGRSTYAPPASRATGAGAGAGAGAGVGAGQFALVAPRGVGNPTAGELGLGVSVLAGAAGRPAATVANGLGAKGARRSAPVLPLRVAPRAV